MRLERWFYTVPLRLRSLFRRRRLDEELDEELVYHVEQKTQEYITKGLDPREARRAALLDMGGIEQRKEECRDARKINWLEDFIQDLHHGFRMLRKNLGFTTVAVLTLALGIGVNTAIFSIVNSFVWKPLPVKDPARLTVLAVERRDTSFLSFISYPDFVDYRKQSNAFTDMAGFTLDLVGLSTEGTAHGVFIAYVTGNYFSMLGVQPGLGRLILPTEGQHRGADPVIVLGHAFWEREFGSDPGIVGRTLKVNGQPVMVIGVVPKEFRGTFSVAEMDAYLPLSMTTIDPAFREFWTERDRAAIEVLAYPKPDVTLQQAQTSLNVIARQLEMEYPATNKGKRVRVLPERLARPEPSIANQLSLVVSLFVLLAGLVLLVACVNVANLLLVRSTLRQKEIAIRTSLGAGPLRMARQLLTESLLLGFLGGAAGTLLGFWASRLLGSIRLPGALPIRFDFEFDWRVFAFALFTASLTGMLTGSMPVFRATKTNLSDTLREGGRSLSGGAERHRVRNALVVAQVCGSFLLLIAAGLFVRSLEKAQSVDLGFDPRNVLNASVDPGQLGYDEVRAKSFYKGLGDRIRTLPGVESVSLAHTTPLGNVNSPTKVWREGQANPRTDELPGAFYNAVDPGYFQVMRIGIVSGRALTDADNETAQRVAIVNETMARRLWPNKDPIGKQFSFKGPAGPFVQIVGVSRRGKYVFIAEDPQNFFYVPLAQNFSTGRVLQIRTTVPPETLRTAVEQEVRTLDPDLPLYGIETMEQALSGGNGFFLFRMGAMFAAALGLLGLVLAVVGVYGVVSNSANQRTHEIGVRIALGAKPRDILQMMLRSALLLLLVGISTGCVMALGLGWTMRNLLVGVGPADSVTFLGVGLLLASATLVASWIPARRAMGVDPMVALRYE